MPRPAVAHKIAIIPRMSGFDAARRAALMQDLVGHVLGRPVDLLPFERVRERLRLRHLVDRGLREVPLDAIVGSLGREREFNREFLPREESLRERWEDADDMAGGLRGYPAVELYQVGDTYFVVDGHHRISVARASGQPAIEARVKEFLTPVPLSPEDSTEDVLLKGSLADFLEATGLTPETPDEFLTREPGGYERLLEHISVHRWYRGIETGRPVSWEEAVRSWRDAVYRPMIRLIRGSGVLDLFPGGTATDLYLFTMAHLHDLRQRYAPRPISMAAGVRHWAFTRRARRGGGLLARLRRWWGGRISPEDAR
jgi:hypothetical protein